MFCDLFMSPTVIGLLSIQLSWAILMSFSFSLWLAFLLRAKSSLAWRISLFPKYNIFLETVFRKEKADLSLWISTSVVSNKYSPGRTWVKFNYMVLWNVNIKSILISAHDTRDIYYFVESCCYPHCRSFRTVTRVYEYSTSNTKNYRIVVRNFHKQCLQR